MRLSGFSTVTGLHQVVILVRNRFTSGCHGSYYIYIVFSTSQVYIRLSWYLVRNRFTSGCHGIYYVTGLHEGFHGI